MEVMQSVFFYVLPLSVINSVFINNIYILILYSFYCQIICYHIYSDKLLWKYLSRLKKLELQFLKCLICAHMYNTTFSMSTYILYFESIDIMTIIVKHVWSQAQWCLSVILVLGKQRWKDYEFKAQRLLQRLVMHLNVCLVCSRPRVWRKVWTDKRVNTCFHVESNVKKKKTNNKGRSLRGHGLQFHLKIWRYS